MNCGAEKAYKVQSPKRTRRSIVAFLPHFGAIVGGIAPFVEPI